MLIRSDLCALRCRRWAAGKPGALRPARIDVKASGVMMMDIRALHRGSSDADMCLRTRTNTEGLLSTVFGPVSSAFAQAMQAANAHRMADGTGTT